MKSAAVGLLAVFMLNGCVRAVQVPTLSDKRRTHCALEVDLTCNADPNSPLATAQAKGAATVAAVNGAATEKDAFKARQAAMTNAYGSNPPNWWHIDYRSGAAFCANIVRKGEKAKLERRAWGWSLAAVGSAGTGALTAYAAEAAGNGKEAAALGVAVAAAAVVAIVGAALINRGNAAAKASFAAETALRRHEGDNDKLWEECLDIRTEWGADDSSAASP